MKMPRSREVGRLVSIHAGDHQPLPNPEAEQAMTFEDDSESDDDSGLEELVGTRAWPGTYIPIWALIWKT